MTPVARVRVQYEPGSAQAALMAAVERRYPNRFESFFEAVASRLNITRDSASGAFYGFLAGRRGLPDDHRGAYRALLRVTDELLDEVGAQRSPVSTPRRRDRLEELEAKVDDLTKALEKARRATAAIQRRVVALEQAQEGLSSQSRRAGPAKPRARRRA